MDLYEFLKGTLIIGEGELNIPLDPKADSSRNQSSLPPPHLNCFVNFSMTLLVDAWRVLYTSTRDYRQHYLLHFGPLSSPPCLALASKCIPSPRPSEYFSLNVTSDSNLVVWEAHKYYIWGSSEWVLALSWSRRSTFIIYLSAFMP